MQTFDVSVNILNDKLLFSSSGGKGGPVLKKERVESAPTEAPAKTGSARFGPGNTALFLGVLQLIVFSIVVSSQTSLSYVHMWTLAASIILLIVPVCAYLAMPGPRCGASVWALWGLLCLHDAAICMLMNVPPLVVVLATLVAVVGARALTFCVDRA